MKFSLKKVVIAVLFLLLSYPVPGLAQPPDSYSEENEMMGHPPMMRPGMDHPMGMEHPGMGQMWGHEYGGGKPHWMKPHNAAVHFLQMKDALGLSEKQVADLKALRDAYRAENTVNEAKLESAEQELREILEEDTINLEKAEAKLKEIGSLEGPVWSNFVKQLAKIKTIVPKEQMKKMHGMQRPHPMMERE
jgi:hypothetical protein